MGIRANKKSGPQNKYDATTTPGVSNDNTEGYESGSRWLDTTGDCGFTCTDPSTGSAVWIKSSPVHEPVVVGDRSVVVARRTSQITDMPQTATDVTFDATDVENDADVLQHNDTNTDRIDIKSDGLYRILYYCCADNTSAGARTVSLDVRKNDTTILTGSAIVCDVAKAESNSFTISVIVSLTDGDFISLRAWASSNNVNVLAGAKIEVSKMEGVQGSVGPSGADGDITWEGNWVSQNYTANQAVKYTNGNSYVCKLNTVSSEVPTNATYWDVLAEKGDQGNAQTTENIYIFTHSNSSKSTASATYLTATHFIFRGSTVMGTPADIDCIAWSGVESSGGKVRLYDVTNSLVICEATGITNTTQAITDMGTISNVPTGEAIWEVQWAGDGTNITDLAAVSIKY